MIFCTIMTVITWTGWIVARLTVGGMCERPELAENFVAADYLGRWYQMYQSTTVPFGGGDCIEATYSLYDDGVNIRVNNQNYDIATDDFGGNWGGGVPPVGDPTTLFTAHCSDWTPGNCQVKPYWFTPYSAYKVVGIDFTDANGYSLVYGCNTLLAGAFKVDYMWVLTKTALQIGTAAHTTMKTTVFDILNTKLPSYDWDTFFVDTE